MRSRWGLLALWVIGAIWMAGIPAAAAEKSKAEVLGAACEHLVEVLNEKDLTALFGMMEKMKEAGLSWNKELTLPVSGIVACKTPEELYVLWGMYAIDMTYAHLFGKGFEDIVAARVELEDRIGFPRDAFKKPVPESDREEKKNKSIEMIHEMIRQSQENPVLLHTFVGGFYGSTLELFYLFCSLGLAAGVTDQVTDLINSHIPQLDLTYQILDAYEENGELAQLLDVGGRKAVIQSIMDVVKASLGNVREEDLQKVLSVVEPVRAPLKAPCQ